MNIAIRKNDVFVNYFKRFSDEEITGKPYNYQIAIVPDDVDITDITYADFDNVDGKYIFNAIKYSARIITEKENDKQIEYKSQIDELIREKYSINDEIAILRQRDTKPIEYEEYFDFVERIKQNVKANTFKL